MIDVHPGNWHYLHDIFGVPITEGSCVVDSDGQVGYVRLDLGPYIAGPDSFDWDGWFNVTSGRGQDPARGKPMKGALVQAVGGGRF